MKPTYEHLLSPLVVRGHVLKNRMEAANSLPHFLQGPEPYPADSVIAHYANKAKNGAAIVTCMGINNFSRGNQLPMELDIAHFPDYDLYDPTCQNYLLQLADAIHYYDSIACMGFFVGPQSGYPLVEENGLRLVPAHKDVGEYTEETMNEIADSYAEQIKILKFLGFDMCSVHYAYRGQLPGKFLSPLHNQRTDEFGGSTENRARFPLMILQRIREAVGDDFIIELLMSAEEPDGGYTLDDTVTFLKMAEPYLDIVQLRAMDVDAAHPTGFTLEETPFIDYADYIKKSGVDVFISTIGGYQNLDICNEVIKEGQADIIGMARSWISNPNYGALAYEGNQEDVVPCIRCNKCHGRGRNDPFVSVCSVNPIIGLEHCIDRMIEAPKRKQNVAVIGGGPTGMKCAIELHDRGHCVTLYETEDTLGGLIRHADYVDFKWPLRDFKNHLIHQVKKRSIDLRLSTKATPELIEQEGYDVVVAALGAVANTPPIPGIDKNHVIYATEALSDLSNTDLGKNVVVIGGGEVGVEAGMHVAKEGYQTIVLEMRDELAPDTTLIHYREMFEAAWEAIPEFTFKLQANVKEITNNSVVYTDADGREQSVPADSVIISAGMRPLKKEALSFFSTAQYFYMAGDCKRPATVQESMRSAYATASRI